MREIALAVRKHEGARTLERRSFEEGEVQTFARDAIDRGGIALDVLCGDRNDLVLQRAGVYARPGGSQARAALRPAMRPNTAPDMRPVPSG